MTTREATPVVLTLEKLAERWSMPASTLRRRIARLHLPAVNVGTDKEPDIRFRLSAIEAWEAANESTLGVEEAPGVPVLTGVPPGLEGYDPFKGGKAKKGRRAK